MRALKIVLFFLLAVAPLSTPAEVSPGNVPAAAVWYFHADFEAMRSGEAGQRLYTWLDDEVFEEIRDESGVDLGKEAMQMTAYAEPDTGIVIVFDGDISQESEDKMMAMAMLSGDMDLLDAEGKQYYFFSENGDADNASDDMEIESLEDSAYVSFALKDKVIVTSSQETMRLLLDNNGSATIPSSQEGTLFVLSADRSLMQAGVIADEFGDYDDDWDSNILQNTKQIALLVSDEGEKIAIEARLVTSEPKIASSLASIARGLISLQVFSDDIDDELKGALSGTTVDVDGSLLNIKVTLDPDVVANTNWD
jgi:hypothetical protein